LRGRLGRNGGGHASVSRGRLPAITRFEKLDVNCSAALIDR
jgi:hypothetical protein